MEKVFRTLHDLAKKFFCFSFFRDKAKKISPIMRTFVQRTFIRRSDFADDFFVLFFLWLVSRSIVTSLQPFDFQRKVAKSKIQRRRDGRETNRTNDHWEKVGFLRTRAEQNRRFREQTGEIVPLH